MTAFSRKTAIVNGYKSRQRASNRGKTCTSMILNWPTDIAYWLRNDATLTAIKNDAVFKAQLKKYKPDMKFFLIKDFKFIK